LPAAFRAFFIVAIRMMMPARRYIAVRATMPCGQMKLFGIKWYFGKAGPIRIFDGGVPLTGHDGRLRHDLPTAHAYSHCFSKWAYWLNSPILKRCSLHRNGILNIECRILNFEPQKSGLLQHSIFVVQHSIFPFLFPSAAVGEDYLPGASLLCKFLVNSSPTSFALARMILSPKVANRPTSATFAL
jgi:hypothetical protein